MREAAYKTEYSVFVGFPAIIKESEKASAGLLECRVEMESSENCDEQEKAPLNPFKPATKKAFKPLFCSDQNDSWFNHHIDLYYCVLDF